MPGYRVRYRKIGWLDFKPSEYINIKRPKKTERSDLMSLKDIINTKDKTIDLQDIIIKKNDPGISTDLSELGASP